MAPTWIRGHMDPGPATANRRSGPILRSTVHLIMAITPRRSARVGGRAQVAARATPARASPASTPGGELVLGSVGQPRGGPLRAEDAEADEQEDERPDQQRRWSGRTRGFRRERPRATRRVLIARGCLQGWNRDEGLIARRRRRGGRVGWFRRGGNGGIECRWGR